MLNFDILQDLFVELPNKTLSLRSLINAINKRIQFACFRQTSFETYTTVTLISCFALKRTDQNLRFGKILVLTTSLRIKKK